MVDSACNVVLVSVKALVIIAAIGSTGAAWGFADSGEHLIHREARLPLAAPLTDQTLVGFEPITPDRYPNYVRMMGLFADGGPAMANLARSVIYDGRVEPELKMAMGLAIALDTNAQYTAAHMRRLLGGNQRGRTLMEAVEAEFGGTAAVCPAADRLAFACGIALTHDVYGLDDEQFAELRGHYSEPQIVELTLVACFFSYFNRMVESINLPLESWALSPASERLNLGSYAKPQARIGLLSNDEVAIIAERLDSASNGGPWDDVVIANSIRAMGRCPDIREAWGRMGSAMGESHISRVMQHYVSNEVSYRNNCYYCKTHQVRKLFHDGVDINHIARTINSDDALTDLQRQAVLFARKVTDDPTSVTDAEFASLRKSFTDLGALEVLHVAARFNFMNRFTAGLGLPSEPVSIVIYDDVEAARKN